MVRGCCPGVEVLVVPLGLDLVEARGSCMRPEPVEPVDICCDGHSYLEENAVGIDGPSLDR